MKTKAIPVQKWINARLDLLGEKAEDSGIKQACRFRDSAAVIATSYEEYVNCAYVVGEHISKSEHLPVVRYSANGLTIVLRDNFYDVTMTVSGMNAPLESQMMLLARTICMHGIDDNVPSCSFEGFPDVYKRKSYLANPKLFSVMLGRWEDAYTFMRCIGTIQKAAK